MIKTYIANTSRVKSRKLAGIINQDPTFQKAVRDLGLWESQLYHWCARYGIPWVKLLLDYIGELLENGHFITDGNQSNFTNDRGKQTDRARKCLIHMANNGKSVAINLVSDDFKRRWASVLKHCS